jgi:hypothetical protein
MVILNNSSLCFIGGDLHQIYNNFAYCKLGVARWLRPEGAGENARFLCCANFISMRIPLSLAPPGTLLAILWKWRFLPAFDTHLVVIHLRPR